MTAPGFMLAIATPPPLSPLAPAFPACTTVGNAAAGAGLAAPNSCHLRCLAPAWPAAAGPRPPLPALRSGLAGSLGPDVLDPRLMSAQSCGCSCRCSRGLARVVSTWAAGDIRASRYIGQPAWDRFAEPGMPGKWYWRQMECSRNPAPKGRR
jgi:hypothetical protein